MGFLKNVWMRIEKAYNTSEEEPAPPGVSPQQDDEPSALLNEEIDPTPDEREAWRNDTR